MAREKKDNIIITFTLPRKVAEEFDEEIALGNETTGASFTRTQMLQVLIIRFLIVRAQEREDIAKRVKNKEEE